MVSADKSRQWSVSAVESLLFCISNLITRGGSTDTYQPNSVLAPSCLLNRK